MGMYVHISRYRVTYAICSVKCSLKRASMTLATKFLNSVNAIMVTVINNLGDSNVHLDYCRSKPVDGNVPSMLIN